MIILEKHRPLIFPLSPEDVKNLLLALLSGPEISCPELSSTAQIAYAAISEDSRRVSEKKSINGQKGGAPKNNQNARKNNQKRQPEVRTT